LPVHSPGFFARKTSNIPKAHGRYLTKALIRAYMNAVAAPDFTTVVAVDTALLPH
jgi:hypothetical protein